MCLRAADAPDDPETRRKTEEEAERWRMGGGFMRGEVTVTRLGEYTATDDQRVVWPAEDEQEDAGRTELT